MESSPLPPAPSYLPLVYPLIRPFLMQLDPERAHQLAFAAGGLGEAVPASWLQSLYHFEAGTLEVECLGRTFRSPLGLAAGFDKNARRIDLWNRIGFGFVEAGSVTAQAREGNPRPRAFRLKRDRALINRMGLNNEGAEAVAKRLEALGDRPLPLGINIAKTHDPEILGERALEDFRSSFRTLAPYADYVTLNVSCPNTREGKTFEEPEAFRALLETVMAEREEMALRVPVLVKLSPPISETVVYDSGLEVLVGIAREQGVAGFIATNTAPDRLGLSTSAETLEAIGPGGLSGRPLARRATRLVRELYRLTEGEVPIIGVGGIDSAEAAYERIKAGATLVQLYTGLVYEGPALVKRIKQGLVRLLAEDGYQNVRQAVGVEAGEWTGGPLGAVHS